MSHQRRVATLDRMQSVLNHTGLLVLDAHRSALDVIRTALNIRKHFPTAKMLMPIAGYLVHVPIIKSLLLYWAKVNKIEIVPVYRKVDENPQTFWMWFFCQFYPKSLTSDIKKERNIAYQQKATSWVKTKNSILLAAPYGTTLPYGGGRVMGGIIKLILSCDYYCVSYSKVISFRSTVFSDLVKGEMKTDYDEFFLSEFNKLIHPELSTEY